MANIQHKVIPDADLHEPKGVSGASSGTVYVADGLGSGQWIKNLHEGIQIGSGTLLTKFVIYSVIINPPAPSGGLATFTVSVPGLVAGSDKPLALIKPTFVTAYTAVNLAITVSDILDVSMVTSADLPSETYTLIVIRS